MIHTWGQVLAVRRVGGRGYRRPASDGERRAHLHPQPGAQRVLVRPPREGLRQVSHTLNSAALNPRIRGKGRMAEWLGFAPVAPRSSLRGIVGSVPVVARSRGPPPRG